MCDAWTRRLTITPGHLEGTRRNNGEELFRYHVSTEMQEELDVIVSQERAQKIVAEMNKIGYPQSGPYMKEQLPDVDHKKYEKIPVFLYVTDRCNRE